MIEPHGLTVAAAAKVLGVSRPALSMLLNGRSDLSGTMALRIEKAFGVRMETLMRMQSSYDIARTRRREGEVMVERFRPPGELIPASSLLWRNERLGGLSLGVTVDSRA